MVTPTRNGTFLNKSLQKQQKNPTQLYNLRNCILKKTAMKPINIIEHKIYTFIFIYD